MSGMFYDYLFKNIESPYNVIKYEYDCFLTIIFKFLHVFHPLSELIYGHNEVLITFHES